MKIDYITGINLIYSLDKIQHIKIYCISFELI